MMRIVITAIALMATCSTPLWAEGVNHCGLAGTTQHTASTQDAGREYTYVFAPDMKTVEVTNAFEGRSRTSTYRLRYWKRSGKWTFKYPGVTVTVCDPKNPGFVSLGGNGWSRKDIPFY